MLLTPWGRYTSNFLLLDANETNDFFAFQNYSVFKKGGGVVVVVRVVHVVRVVRVVHIV